MNPFTGAMKALGPAAYASDRRRAQSSTGPFGREAVGEYRTRRIEAREVRQRGRDAVCYDFAASFVRCPSSGMISRSIASRTAAVEPGIKKTAVPSTMPAQARLSIAAAPIS